MKITKDYLRKVIKESIQEAVGDEYGPDDELDAGPDRGYTKIPGLAPLSDPSGGANRFKEPSGQKVFTVSKEGVLMGVYMDKAAALAAGKKAGATVKSVPVGKPLRQAGEGSGAVIYSPERY